MEYLKKYRRIFTIVLGVVVLICFLWMAKALFLGYYPDFVTQYTVPVLVFSGANPYIGGEGLYTPQVYPPTTFLFFWPFTLFPLLFASYFYTFLSIACLVGSVYLLLRLYDEKVRSLSSLMLTILVFIYFPVKFTLGMGQINHFILLLLVFSLFFLKRKQEFRAGIFLGLSIVIKLFPLFLPLYFFIKIKKIPHGFKDKFHWSGFFKLRVFNFKFWFWPSQVSDNMRLLWGIVLVLLLAIILVVITIPMELSLHFVFEVLPSLANSWKLDYYNQALSGFVGRSFGTDATGTILKIAASGVISLGSLYAVSKNERQDFLTIALKFGTLITVSLLVNTFSWQHHFVWLIIPLYSTFFYLRKLEYTKKYYVFLALAYFLVSINFKDPNLLPVLFQSHAFFGAMILLLVQIKLLFDTKKE